MADLTPENRPLIQQINFNETGVEIVYAERRHIESFERTGISRTTVIGIPKTVIDQELIELFETLQDILDRAEVTERNPTFGR